MSEDLGPPRPVTDNEIKDLALGLLSSAQIEDLFCREFFWGRVTPPPGGYRGLVPK